MSGNDPSVVVAAELGLLSDARLALQRLLITFVPSTPGFAAGFATLGDYGPVNARRAMVLTPTNYRSRLEAAGAASDEPIWRALDAFWNPRGALDISGSRTPDPVALTDYIVIGTRELADPTSWNLDVTSNAVGFITVTIDPQGSGDGTARILTERAQVVVESDGVKTIADLRDEIVAGLTAIAAFTSVATAAPGGPADLDVDTIADGYPLIVRVSVTSGGPTYALVNNTPYPALSWETDFDDVRQAVETDGLGARAFWHVHDLQGLDALNLAAANYMDTLAAATVPAQYIYWAWSYSLENFDPLAVGSPAEVWRTAAFTRASLWDHDLAENLVPALLGRALGYRPGEVVFSALELNGSVDAAIITKRAKGANEYLANEENRSFNFYSGDGPAGETKWGLLPAARQATPQWIDNTWLTDWLKFVCERDLATWKRSKSIVTYTDDEIVAGGEVLRDSAAAVPAILADTVAVSFLTRAMVSPADRQARRYNYWVVDAEGAGAMVRLGQTTFPIKVNVSV